MTREEAISNLEDILEESTRHEDSVCYVTGEDAETLKIAISALRQVVNGTNVLCTDTISRQSAIELIENESRKWGDEYGISDVLCDLSDMPSTQPEKRTDKRTETHECDYISRQAAIDRINKQREHLEPNIFPQDKIGDAAYRICAEFIERLPSAQPEIIRCKECKYWFDIDDGRQKHRMCADFFGEWFCADAERRTDERSD